MPLSQHDPDLGYDSSWAEASESWPAITFENEMAAKRAYVIAWRDCRVPYGSYVLVGNVLRLEMQVYVEQVRQALRAL